MRLSLAEGRLVYEGVAKLTESALHVSLVHASTELTLFS